MNRQNVGRNFVAMTNLDLSLYERGVDGKKKREGREEKGEDGGNKKEMSERRFKNHLFSLSNALRKILPHILPHNQEK